MILFRTISVSTYTTDELTKLIETLESMLKDNVVVVEGLDEEQIKSVRNQLAGFLGIRGFNAIVLNHKITTEWLEEVMSSSNSTGDVTVFGQVTDSLRRFNILESIREKVLAEGVMIFRPGQIMFGR